MPPAPWSFNSCPINSFLTDLNVKIVLSTGLLNPPPSFKQQSTLTASEMILELDGPVQYGLFSSSAHKKYFQITFRSKSFF